jgi:hypothetical protein
MTAHDRILSLSFLSMVLAMIVTLLFGMIDIALRVL